MREVSEMLGAWNSFYVMIGSSAAALTGLMFVVITLVRDNEGTGSADGISMFSTPTVVHFCSALFTSALMTAPFRSLVPIGIISGLAGGAGLIYIVRIGRRSAKLPTYRLDVEDWACNILVPFVAYTSLITGALAMHVAAAQALFAPALAVILLIFVGIHNAWDVVTFLATGKAAAVPDRQADTQGAEKSSPATSVRD